MPIRAILFDLDGTLVDSERESAEAMARALERGLGIHVDQRDRDFIIGRSWVDIYDHLATRYTLSWDRDRLIAETTVLRAQVFEEMGITVLPGAHQVVERFGRLPMAIVTGSSRGEAAQALDALGLRQVFRAVVASEDVARSKPAPDGYLAAARSLEVDPCDCLVVEDSEAGIAAGLAAGCRVVAVSVGNFAGMDQSRAHRQLATLDELTWALVEAL